MESHTFNKTILQAYDIRGIFEKDLNLIDALFLGKSFATLLKKKKLKNVVIGYDGRISSLKIEKELVKGLLSKGIKVYKIGLVPTPLLYFSMYSRKLDSGIMITGSHNPPSYNGFKMLLKNKNIFGKDILDIAKISSKGEFCKNKKGKVKKISMMNKYLLFLINSANIKKNVKVAWDPGNGSSGKIISYLTKKLNGKHYLINEKIDGTFPAHHPDPTVLKNLKQLINLVKKKKCDFGFAFDGDGDRLGVVDDKGKIIFADKIVAFLAKDVLLGKPNSKIILDIKSSQIVFNEIKKLKGRPIFWKTGHSLIKEKMKELNSPLSGEMSGHIFYADDFFGYDDAMYVALRLLRILGNQSRKLSDLIGEYPATYSTPETRFDVKEIRKFAIIDEIKERLKNTEGEVINIDGIRVQNKLGWFLIRASNTQNQLTCRAEALNRSDLISLTNLIQEQLQLSGVEYRFTHE